MRTTPLVVAASIAVSISSLSSAAPEWVERRIVLSGEPVAGSVDVGMGFGHVAKAPLGGDGVGFDTEAVLGLVSRVDLGLRLGLRVNQESAFAQADAYARFFRPEPTYEFAHRDDTFANPELRVRGKLVDVGVFELGIEGRMLLPAATDSRFVAGFGVPMAVHAGHLVKVDLGIYTTVGAYDAAVFVLDVPANVWFQVTDKVFLGPMTGLRAYSNYFTNPAFDFILGVGLGVHLTKWLDLKSQFVFPRINQGAQFFGAGIGVGFVFE